MKFFHDLADLRQRDRSRGIRRSRLLLLFIPRRRVALAAAEIHPVLRLRIVGAETQAAGAHGLGEGFEQIALAPRGLHGVPVGIGGIIQREAVVVLGGDDDVFHAGVRGELCPGLADRIWPP